MNHLLLLIQVLILLFIPKLTNGQSALEFQFRNMVHWDKLGSSVSVGNGLVVAFNGTHTHILDTNMLPTNVPVQNAGYWAWTLVETDFAFSKRSRFAMASLGNGKALLYGGQDGDGNSLRDAFIVSVSINTKTKEKEVNWSQTKDAPVKRSRHAMAALESGKILIYGGNDQGTFSNDAYFFSITNDKTEKEEGEWIKTNDGPGKREYHAMETLGSGKILMYGGYNGTNFLSGSFIFSTNSQTGKEEGQWTRINVDVPERALHAMSTVEPGKILMYGGVDNKFNTVKTSYIFSTSSKTGTEDYKWTKIVGGPGDGPGVRCFHAMISLAPGIILTYGGQLSNANGLNNAFIFSTKSTTEKEYQWQKSKDGPSPRAYHAMAPFDSNTMLMYGGGTNTDGFSDAFLYQVSINDKTGEEEGQWIQTIQDGPGKRYNHKMASLDLDAGTILMYGGQDDAGNSLNDSYIASMQYNERTNRKEVQWLPTTNGPGKRSWHAMASLDVGTILMYGGRGGNKVFNDSFIFSTKMNEKTGKEEGIWTPTTDGPGARVRHAMATLGPNKILMYGGVSSTAIYFDDTYIFDFNTTTEKGEWTNITTDGPAARVYHAMASMGNGRVVMYGGSDGHTAFNDAHVFGFYGQNSTQHSWTPLSVQATDSRAGHAMAAIGSRILLFGGFVSTKNGLSSASPAVQNDAWTMTIGCPPGMYGSKCSNCNLTSYKVGNTPDNTNCTPCPPETTTASNGSTAENDCVLCNYGHGTVDLTKNYTCTCDFIWKLSSDCSAPWLGIIVLIITAVIVGAIPTIIVFIRKLWQKYDDIVEDHEIELEDLDDIYRLRENKLQGELQETQNDNSKLQQARIIKLTDIKLAEVIGKGAFGEVRKGRWRGLDVAVKKMFPEEMEKFGYDKMLSNKSTASTKTTESTASTSSTNGLNEIAKTMLGNLEIGVMMRLNHPRIVAFLGAGEIVDPPLEGDDVPRVGIFVMLQYAAGGDLIHRLQAAAGSTTLFPWSDRIQCALDIAEGMKYIHSQGFLHRDLKSLNVLCDAKGRCMIADLGLVCSNLRPDVKPKDYQQMEQQKKSIHFNHHIPFAGETNFNTTWQGTAGWMAPEAMGTNNYGFKADVYSFGIVMYELLTCRIPWAGSRYTFTHLIKKAVMRGERPNIKKKDLAEAPDNFVKLMEVCWDIDPKKRPSFDDIFEQLKQLNNDVIFNCESPWQTNEFYGKGDNKIDVLIATDGTVFTLPSAR
jgi:serine/threonine protein kinase